MFFIHYLFIYLYRSIRFSIANLNSPVENKNLLSLITTT